MSARVRRSVLVWVVGLCVLGGALVFGSTVFAAGDANVAACSAETEASPGFRPYLPDCRAFELVTPPYKEGGVVLSEGSGAVSADGSRVIVGVGGAFAGTGNYWYEPGKNTNAVAYELTRGAVGWQSSVLTPPASEYPYSLLMAVSARDFATTLWGAGRAGLPDHEDIFLRTGGGSSEFHPVGPGTPEVAGEEVLANDNTALYEELSFVGASADLTHSLFQIEVSERLGHSDVWPGDTTEANRQSLYEYAYTGVRASEPLLVGVRNSSVLKSDTEAQLISDCGTELGSGHPGSMYNAVSEEGATVFFTASACAGGVGGPAVNELYARIGGATTVSVSEPAGQDCEACNTTTGLQSAVFQGASRDGSRAFFVSEQELLPGAKGTNVYEYDFNGPAASPADPDGKISLVSGCSATPGECSAQAGVQGVVRVSQDGERVYFVATGKLAGENREAQAPEEGADNLYVYEPDGAHPGGYHTVFVATLLTSGEETVLQGEEAEEAVKVNERVEKVALGAFEEAINKGATFLEAFELYGDITNETTQALSGTLGPAGTLVEDQGVWLTQDGRPVQATPDGGFLVFPSSAHLTAGDTSKVAQLFEYDAGGETLTRVSIDQSGSANGSVETFRDAPRISGGAFNEADRPTGEDTGLAVSGDGSEVFFTSAASLAPQASQGSVNVYEYRQGNVYMVSGGADASRTKSGPAVVLLGIDPSGQDAFFSTAQALVPQDGETQQALYDAREGGGFPAPVLEPGCVGETCRGASGMPPALLSAGSTAQGGAGNIAPPVSKSVAGRRSKPLTRAQKLARALKACRALHARRRRVQCEAQARGRFGVRSVARGVSGRGVRAARAAGKRGQR